MFVTSLFAFVSNKILSASKKCDPKIAQKYLQHLQNKIIHWSDECASNIALINNIITAVLAFIKLKWKYFQKLTDSIPVHILLSVTVCCSNINKYIYNKKGYRACKNRACGYKLHSIRHSTIMQQKIYGM